jgi:DNA-binding NtrC family response regulator
MPPEGRRGHLLAARGGTLFIDDCERLPEAAQQLLLAATDAKPGLLTGLGGLQERPDVRVIFATNHDLDALVESRRIRPDLRFRAPHTLRLPPLRDRRSDIVLLARHFATQFRARLLERALVALVRFDWPGNVRQLRETVERAAEVANSVARLKKGDANVQASRVDLLLDHLLLLPDDHRRTVASLGDSEVSSQFWSLIVAAAGGSGPDPSKPPNGLYSRMAEVSGYDRSHAWRMYRRWVLGLTDAEDGQATA